LDHQDEVLNVAFSPCGTRLATSSRDRTTAIYQFDATGRPRLRHKLQHSSAALIVRWCPEPPHQIVFVSTEGPDRPLVELWDTEAGTKLFEVQTQTHDAWSAFVRHPPLTGDYALLACTKILLTDTYAQLFAMVSLSGDTRFRAVQQMVVRWPANYIHADEPAPPGSSQDGSIAGLSGTTPRQCDQVVVIDLVAAQPRAATGSVGDAPRQMETVEPTPRVLEMRERAILCVKWAEGAAGRSLLLINTRPRVNGPPEESLATQRFAPPPMIASAIELMVLDAATLTVLSTHGGHHAFTLADAPFVLWPDAWADTDIIASGGEDHCVHIWHRRHRRQLRRLEAHTAAVNVVAWCPTQRLLASASDDHTALLWSCKAT